MRQKRERIIKDRIMSLSLKEKKLIKNTGILAIGTLLSKVLSFFLIPLYTASLSTDDYGRVDVLQTVAYLLLPIVSLELASATFRFLIDCDRDKSKREVISSSTFMQLINCVAFLFISFIINCFIRIGYFGLFVLYFISMILLNHLQYIIRGFSKNKLFSIVSLAVSSLLLALNIFFIAVLRCQADAILVAGIISNTVGIIIASICISLWKYIDVKMFSPKTLKEMLKYSFPLIPNEISWWIANASDRLIIRWFIGVSSNGIYAVANKIPAIYTSLFTIYNLALVESVSKEANSKDFSKYVNEVFKKSFKLFGCICLLIIIAVSIVSGVLLGNNYVEAYNHIFILMIAIFFNSLCSIIGSILTGLKDSKTIGLTTSLGALVNIVINLSLVDLLGLYAASISTFVSYVIIFILRYTKVLKHVRLSFPIAFIARLVLMTLLVSAAYFIHNVTISIIVSILLILWSFIENREIIFGIFGQFAAKLKKGKQEGISL